MPITEEKALELLTELIKKPETNAAEVPRIWAEIVSVYNKQFAPEEPKKKKRRRTSTNPNLGWPSGVSRAEYMAWKESQQKSGKTEGLNPQEYKRMRDAGLVKAIAPAAKAEKKAAPAKAAAAKPAAAAKAAPGRKPAAKK